MCGALGFLLQAMVDDLPLSQLLEANRSVFSLQRSLLPCE